MTADITRREVIAGPAEASALGNVLVQAVALGYLSGADEMREVARASVSVDHYLPAADERAWDATYERFLKVTGLASPRPVEAERGRNN